MATPPDIPIQNRHCRRGARVECEKHGVHRVKVPWAEPNSRFTVLMERMVIDMHKEIMCISSVAKNGQKQSLTILDKDYLEWVKQLSSRYKSYLIKASVHINSEQLKFLNIPAKINRHSGIAETARPEYRKPL